MKATLTTALKRFDFPRLLTRTTRGIPSLWRKAGEDLHQERQLARLLQRRGEVTSAYLRNHPVPKLQVGAGTNPLAGWLNTDLQPMNDDILYLNALEPFPFQDNTFDYVFSEHMVEHITYKDGLFMFSECFRVLKPGGRIRVATPDVTRIVGLFDPQKDDSQSAYISWSSDHLGFYSKEKTELQRRRQEWDLEYSHFRKHFPDKSQDPVCFIVNNFFRSYGHQFLYDAPTLKAALAEAGFSQATAFAPAQSNDELLRNIESHQTLIGDEMNRFETLVIEAVHP